MMKMRNSALFACIFAFATLIAQPSFAATQEAAGFLLDYAQLQPVPADPGLVRYAAPDVRARLTKKIYLALRHFTPVGIAAKAVKAAAGVSTIRLHSAALEAECFTPDGKERLFAMVDRRTGKGGSGEVRWDQLLEEVRDRARRVRSNLDAAAK